ncbi:MAG TPA: class I SAM-dependent methyltransferase [Candidatus Diapherotrites archaeon]|uniref:Class I SAM-dependent methyltransferase n=1 Tax=Candidatus Iainarchaeum sp. TaxID=3101447 RepID=A0A7J4IVP2_9ARCH|nr:class I SAM-dependent methyltransferase [Candidatus Diapherotrites archaeon]
MGSGVKHFFSNGAAGVGHWTTERINSYEPSKGSRVLDVACGNRKIRGAVGIDCDRASAADKIWSDDKPIPFKDNYFDEVFCLNFLEHTFNFDKALTEIHRVLRPGGIAHIEVPYYNSYNFGQTPFHHIMFCETTMRDWYTRQGTFSRYSKAKFRIDETELYFTKPAILLPAGIRIKIAHYIPNLCYQIYWKLAKD